MNKKKTIVLVSLGLLLVVAGCQRTKQEKASEEPTTLTVLTHDSYDVSQDVIKRFEEENNVHIEFVQGGDAGSVLNTAILNKDNPVADILYGVDNTFLSRALDADIFETYESSELASLVEAVKKEETQNKMTPVDYGDVCVNYDKAWFSDHDVAVPTSLEDLTKPEYKDLLVIENPASSSPGLAFLLTTIGVYGEDEYLNFWNQLRTNGVTVADGWEDAYWGEFSAASDGIKPLVVSYATSPAAEVYYSEGAYSEPQTGVISGRKSCFRQIEYTGILHSSKNTAIAQKFVDYMLSREYQEDIPLHMWVFPARADVTLPQVFTDFALQVEDTAEVSSEQIAAKREQWIEDWENAVVK